METPGMILKREREVKGLSLKGISEVTRIPVSALEAIENNDFDSFPAEVFVKGFVRNYARELMISTDEVMHAYDAMRGQKPRVHAVEVVPAVSEAVAPVRETEHDAKSSLVFSVGEKKRSVATPNASQEAIPHSFRLAYILVALIAVGCIALSVAFTGTSEAEESDMMYNEDAGESDNSAFLISNTAVSGWSDSAEE